MYRLLSLLRVDAISRFVLGGNKAIILLYHNPKKEIFEKHMAYLNNHYRFISLEELVLAVHTKNKKALRNSAVVTFDDGHANNFDLLNTFKKYSIKPTIYLCTAVVTNQSKYWWSGIKKPLVESLKLVSNKERIKTLNELEDYDINASSESLTKAQIMEMSDHVHFGNHTRNHPIVTNLDDTELRSEIGGAIDEIDYLYNLDHFAFPNGDYSDREIEYLKSINFKSARTTDSGYTSIDSDIMRLKIAGITDNASIDKFKVQISCLFGWALCLVKFKNFYGKKRN